MSQTDTAHAWWSRLRHQGLLLSPVVMVERYPTAPPAAQFLGTAETSGRPDPLRIAARCRKARGRGPGPSGDPWLHWMRFWRTSSATPEADWPGSTTSPRTSPPSSASAAAPRRSARTGSSSPMPSRDRPCPARDGRHVAAGRPGPGPHGLLPLPRTLRGTGHRLGLLTNGQQFRLDLCRPRLRVVVRMGEPTAGSTTAKGPRNSPACGNFFSPESLKPVKEGVSGLLDAVEESRKRQADLSSVLRENVRQAVELLLEEVSTANRTKPDLFDRTGGTRRRPHAHRRRGPRGVAPGHGAGGHAAGGLPVRRVPATAAGQRSDLRPVLRRPVALRTAGGSRPAYEGGTTPCSTGRRPGPG